MNLYPLILFGGAALAGFIVVHELSKFKRTSEELLAAYAKMLRDARAYRSVPNESAPNTGAPNAGAGAAAQAGATPATAPTAPGTPEQPSGSGTASTASGSDGAAAHAH